MSMLWKSIQEQIQHKNKEAVNQCDLCDKTFANKYSFKRHMSDHLLDEALECPSCKKEFQSRSYFEQHIKEAHEDYTWPETKSSQT